ncbi:MAG: UDP-N-acetylglucosamine 3-dehydrogenase [Isosphaeraceae bacterium]|jgi:predicted dehydrogenase|nr:MAG: UDP-N-acetylglucosamine 3-dehydrogenase [Isosphaeraceae bacterium]
MNELRVAVVGVGHLGRHHARLLAGMAGVRLVGVVDTREDQARHIAAQFGTRAYTDFLPLLDHVDAVSIAVPTVYHHRVATAFLSRGIPVLVEKPLAPSVAEAEALLELADRKGAVLQVGHIERFNPTWTLVERLPGRPRYIAAERLGTYTFRSTDIGVVHDLMIHDLDLALTLVDQPVLGVSAVGTSIFGRLEDVASARIWFEDGTVADLAASRASLHATRKMRLWSPDGYLSLDFKTREGLLVRPTERLRRGDLGAENLDLTQPESVRAHVFGALLETEKLQAEGREPLALEIEDFIEAVRTGRKPRVTGADGLRALRVAEQVVESLREPAHLQVPPRGIPEPHLFRLGAVRPVAPER